jgi:hypothetical protein
LQGTLRCGSGFVEREPVARVFIAVKCARRLAHVLSRAEVFCLQDASPCGRGMFGESELISGICSSECISGYELSAFALKSPLLAGDFEVWERIC